MEEDKVMILNGLDVSQIFMCGVCADKLKNPRVFSKCQHMFCWGCIETHIEVLINGGKTEIPCPYCRCSFEKSTDYFKSKPKEKWEENFSKNLIVSQIMSELSKATAEDQVCKVHISQMYRHFCRDHGEFICGDCLRENHLNGCRVLSIEESEQIARKMVENEICQLQIERTDGMRDFETFCENINSSLNKLKQCRKNLDKVINTLTNKQQLVKEESDCHCANFEKEITNTETQFKSAKTIFELKKCHYEVTKSKGNFANLRKKVLENEDMEETISAVTCTIATINDLPILFKKPSRDKNEGNVKLTCDFVGGRKERKERNPANDETDKTPNGNMGSKRYIKKQAEQSGKVTMPHSQKLISDCDIIPFLSKNETTNGYRNNKQEAYLDKNGGQRHDEASNQSRPPSAWQGLSFPSQRSFRLVRANTEIVDMTSHERGHYHITYDQIKHNQPVGNSYNAVRPYKKLPPIQHKP